MKSDATTVDAYLDEVPVKRRAAIAAIRELCLAELPDYEESMEYNMPSYRRPGGEVEVAFASQVRYVSVYIMRTAALEAHRARLTTNDVGKGCIRYGNPDKIDLEVVRDMLRASALDDGPIC